MNNSSTGGYLHPNPQPPTLVTVPPNLTLIEFLQTVFRGLSGFAGELCRPEWQPEMPKQPDINVNWLAFGIGSATPDNNAYTQTLQATEEDPVTTTLQRNELLEVNLSVYGPSAYDNITLIRDGFQLDQNLALMRQANVIFAYDSVAQHLPDLVNGRWIDRYVTQVFFRRQVQRLYPILNFVSANGTVHAQTIENSDFTQNFNSGS